jgi:hypothetical protein
MDGWMGLRVLFHGLENHTSMERRLFVGGVLYALDGWGWLWCFWFADKGVCACYCVVWEE